MKAKISRDNSDKQEERGGRYEDTSGRRRNHRQREGSE